MCGKLILVFVSIYIFNCDSVNASDYDVVRSNLNLMNESVAVLEDIIKNKYPEIERVLGTKLKSTVNGNVTNVKSILKNYTNQVEKDQCDSNGKISNLDQLENTAVTTFSNEIKVDYNNASIAYKNFATILNSTVKELPTKCNKLTKKCNSTYLAEVKKHTREISDRVNKIKKTFQDTMAKEEALEENTVREAKSIMATVIKCILKVECSFNETMFRNFISDLQNYYPTAEVAVSKLNQNLTAMYGYYQHTINLIEKIDKKKHNLKKCSTDFDIKKTVSVAHSEIYTKLKVFANETETLISSNWTNCEVLEEKFDVCDFEITCEKGNFSDFTKQQKTMNEVVWKTEHAAENFINNVTNTWEISFKNSIDVSIECYLGLKGSACSFKPDKLMFIGFISLIIWVKMFVHF